MFFRRVISLCTASPINFDIPRSRPSVSIHISVAFAAWIMKQKEWVKVEASTFILAVMHVTINNTSEESDLYDLQKLRNLTT